MHELHVDSVNKWFGETQVLTDIFIACKPGDVIGLLGRNGSGKSTLLKIIFGSLKAENKFVRVDGKIVQTLKDSQNKIAYLPQNSFLPSHLNVAKIVDLFCPPEQFHILMESEHVRLFLQRKSRELSGGERRMIEILLILQSQAKYILIDEPFNGVEPLYKDEIKKVIQQHSNTKGFIITDHDYRNILSISTKVMLLQNGGLREIKEAEELVRANYLPGL